MRLIRLLKNDIAREAEEWVGDQIISQDQAEQICSRYGVDYQQINSRSFGYNLLIGLGYLFMGLAVITLLSANWDDIPRSLRMGGLVAATMVIQGLALWKYNSGHLAAGVNGFLFGNLLFGASLILTAQIYHLGEQMSGQIFWWALGCLPIALLTNSRAIALQTLALAVVWFLVEVNMGFYPALFPVFLVAAVIVLLRGAPSILLLLSVVGSLGLWLEYSLAQLWRDTRHFDFQVEHVAVSVALCIGIYALSHWLRRRDSVVTKDYASVLAMWSLRFGLVFMLVLGFEAPWEEMIEANWEHSLSMGTIVLLLSIGALLLVAKTDSLKIIAAFLVALMVTLLAVANSGNIEHAVYFQIVSNVALVLAGVALIVLGINNGISHYFFLGVAAILLTGLMRYADLVGDYIGGAILFMVFAAILLGAAKYWRYVQLRGAQ
jgi:hypothetical protein